MTGFPAATEGLAAETDVPLPAIEPRKPVKQNLGHMRKFLTQHPGSDRALAQRSARYVERAMADPEGDLTDRARAGIHFGRWFPAPGDPGPGAIRATLLRNVPGEGFHQNSEAHHLLIDEATEQLDVINPYVTKHPVIDGLIAAAERGVRTRLILPGKPTPVFMAMALRNHYGRLLDAGVTVLEHPVMCHTKVTLADDRVLIGSCNLDGRSLWMNYELGLFIEDAGFAEHVRRDLVEVEAAKSKPVALAEGRDAMVDAFVDRFWKLL